MAVRRGLSPSSSSQPSSPTVSIPVVYELERGMGEMGGDGCSKAVEHRSL